MSLLFVILFRFSVLCSIRWFIWKMYFTSCKNREYRPMMFLFFSSVIFRSFCQMLSINIPSTYAKNLKYKILLVEACGFQLIYLLIYFCSRQVRILVQFLVNRLYFWWLWYYSIAIVNFVCQILFSLLLWKLQCCVCAITGSFAHQHWILLNSYIFVPINERDHLWKLVYKICCFCFVWLF